MKSCDENQQFFEELFSAARVCFYIHLIVSVCQIVEKRLQDYKTTGVYASKSQWIPIMGDGYSGGSSAQLWYNLWYYLITRNITQMCPTGMHTMMIILRSAILKHLVAGAGQPSSSTKVMLLCVVWTLTKTGTRRNCAFLH